jgi:hypothetical protein
MAQAVRAAAHGEGFPAFVRAGMCSGLIAASVWVALRLRPRLGWGITLHAAGILLSRRSAGKPLELPWGQVEVLPSQGARAGDIVLHDPQGKRVVLTPRLFATQADFRALTQALEQHLPGPPGNA